MTKVALLIGVSEYQPGLNPLPAAVKDVEAMRRVLVNPETGGFADEDITVLKNPQPQDIRNAVYNLFANRRKDDLVLFYFSGHGIKDDRGKLYFSTRATKKDNGKLVKPSAVGASVLHESINDSRSQRQVIILDCCFSGAIATGMTVKDDGSVNLQEQLGGKGRAILTSSSSTQYSFEQEGSELSVYTRYLVEGINTGAGDKDRDGWISIDELHDYASSKVQEASPAMTPKFYPVEEGHKILLAKSPQDDPNLIYRQEVERRAQEGQGIFSTVSLEILELKRNELKISHSDAIAIQEEVLKPYQEYERKRYKYEQVVIKQANKQYPFSQVIQKEIKDYQQYLGLRDEDIAAIEQRVITAKQAISKHPQESKEINQVEVGEKYQEKYQKQEIEVVQEEQGKIQQQETKDLKLVASIKEGETVNSQWKIRLNSTQPSVSDKHDNTVREKLTPRTSKSNKNVVTGVVAIIVLGVLGLLGYQTFIPTESPIAEKNTQSSIDSNKLKKISNTVPEIRNLEEILDTAIEIKHASRLRKLNRLIYEKINQAWKNRQALNQDLFYRVIAAGDGTVLSYQSLNELAEKNINKTPIAGVVYNFKNQINHQTPIRNEPVAQFQVKFLKGGILRVKPWIGYIYKTPELLGTQITDTDGVKELRQKLYNNIWKKWGGVPRYGKNLKYRVAVTKKGVIADYEPLNKAAFDNFRETPLPKMFSAISKSNIAVSNNQEPLAHYQVKFSANGRLKVENWQGYPLRKSNE